MSNLYYQLMSSISSFRSAVDLLGSTLATDVVCVLDQNGRQVFGNARIMRAAINLDSELFSHPLETGNSVVDFKIDKPVIIQLAMLLPAGDSQDTYGLLRAAKTAGDSFVIQTRAGVYPDMVIQTLPHEESNTYGDSLAIALVFKQVQWYEATTESLPAKEVAVSPKSAKTGGTAKPDADTVATGQKRATDATAAEQKKSESILHSIPGWF